MNGIELTGTNYILFPITFKISNSQHISDYFNGLPVDCETADDVTHDFGDPQEGCLKQALEYIQTGSFSSLKSAVTSARFSSPRYKLPKGLRYEIGAY